LAQSTIDEDILRIENELTALRAKISEQEAVKEMEEGGAGSRFRTAFTGAEVLYARERELAAKLNLLYAYRR